MEASTKQENEKKFDEDEEEDDLRCGWFGWTPGCLQRCNNSKALLANLCLLTFAQGGLSC
jgi:hypothetical protein